MKKLYFFIFLAFSGITVSAQTYYPMLDSVNTWNYVSNWIGVRINPSVQLINCPYPLMSNSTSFNEFSTNDTTINAMVYKTIETSNGCIAGFLREDTAAQKIYFQDNLGSPELLLYDFSMTVGNTMNISFINSFGYYSSGLYTLDSITTVHIMAGWRRAFHLNNHLTPNAPTLTWIESVGNLNDLLYPYFENQSGYGWFNTCPGVEHQFYQFMSCFEHMQKVYYDTCAFQTAITMTNCIQFSDSCNYWNICGSVNELSSLSSFDIFPNPAVEKTTLTLDVKNTDEFRIVVWDISGKRSLKEIPLGKITEGKKNIELDLNGLSGGFYLIECRGGKASAYGKLLIRQ